MVIPDYKEIEQLAKEYKVVPICKEIYGDITTPIALLLKIAQSSNRYYLLESIEGGEKWGRYTFLGFNPIAHVVCKNGEIVYEDYEKHENQKEHEENENQEVQEVVPAKRLMHGKQSSIHLANGSSLFKSLPPIIQAARYHSLIVQRASLPDELLVIAEDDGGEVMGVKHRDYEIYGLQFHPESILTPQGAVIMKNFLCIGGEAE